MIGLRNRTGTIFIMPTFAQSILICKTLLLPISSYIIYPVERYYWFRIIFYFIFSILTLLTLLNTNSNLSLSLNLSGIGGSLGSNPINHLGYADDLCLIALSSSRMQCPLDIRDKYVLGHQLSYNVIKSFALSFKLNTTKLNF